MTKKIAFVVSAPMTAQAFLVNHFEKLAQEYAVYLIANFPDEGSKQQFFEMGVVCLDAPILRKISILKDLKALFALRRIFKRQRFDSVHSVSPKAGLLTAVAGWLAGVKIRIHIFTGQVWATKRGPMRLLLKTLDKVIALFDTNILVDGESQRQFLIKEGVVKDKNSIVLAHGSICGVKLENFVVSEDVRAAERNKLGASNEDVVFIFLGRLNHDKGIGELFAAFNKLVLECPNAKLVLYGSDEEGYDGRVIDYPNIKRGVNYHYPGVTKQPYDALQAGDVFVLPTWREGFGSSVIEAQALGLPVITSDAYGVIDASILNVTGLQCKVNDPDGLYHCMNEYYYDPNLRKEHGTAGKKRVEELFDSNVVTDAWVKFYEQLF